MRKLQGQASVLIGLAIGAVAGWCDAYPSYASPLSIRYHDLAVFVGRAAGLGMIVGLFSGIVALLGIEFAATAMKRFRR